MYILDMSSSDKNLGQFVSFPLRPKSSICLVLHNNKEEIIIQCLAAILAAHNPDIVYEVELSPHYYYLLVYITITIYFGYLQHYRALMIIDAYFSEPANMCSTDT